MIGMIFNHNIFDTPYKQSAVKCGIDRLNSLCKNLNEHLCTSFSHAQRGGLFGPDLSDDYIVVHYTADLSDEIKSEIADCIKEMHTLKKTDGYKDKLPEIHIVFSKIQQNDYYCFNITENI